MTLRTLRRLTASVLAATTVLAVSTTAAAPAAAHPARAAADAADLGSAQRPVRIMPLGDSITDGYRRTPDSYRKTLYRHLTGAGLHVDYVGSGNRGTGADNDNEGHSGWRIRNIQERIGEWMADARPDIVLLNIGTNDIGLGDDIRNAPQRLSTLIDTILDQSPSVRIVVAKVGLPPRDAAPGWRPLSPRAGWSRLTYNRVMQARRLPAYNAAIPGVVAGKGPRVSLVDLSGISPLHTDDGLHPDATGFRQQAYLWYQALRPLFRSGGSWPVLIDPIPLPVVRAAVPVRRVRYGTGVAVTGRLSGVLGYGALADQPMQLVWRRAGTSRWFTVRTVRTNSDGTVAAWVRVTAAGDFAFRVAGGRAAGRSSAAVRVGLVQASPR